MGFPIRSYLIDRESEGIVGLADENRCLDLRAVRMQGVSVAEAVGVVVTNDRLP